MAPSGRLCSHARSTPSGLLLSGLPIHPSVHTLHGTLHQLSSSSYALQVLLWKYPDTTAAPLCINTQHRLNIFGVQFLPCSDDSKIVTAAFDRTVQLHTLDRAPLAYPAHRRTAATRGNDRIRPIDCHTVVYSNHSECVKVCHLLFRCHFFSVAYPCEGAVLSTATPLSIPTTLSASSCVSSRFDATFAGCHFCSCPLVRGSSVMKALLLQRVMCASLSCMQTETELSCLTVEMCDLLAPL